jgi:hypothetical protein
MCGRDIIEREDAVAELEEEVCAEGDEGPEWELGGCVSTWMLGLYNWEGGRYDWDYLGLDERWERHELQVEGEVELWNT